jgi:hypothetical protein
VAGVAAGGQAGSGVSFPVESLQDAAGPSPSLAATGPPRHDVVMVWAPKSGAAGDRETRSRKGQSRTNAGCPRLRSWTSSC